MSKTRKIITNVEVAADVSDKEIEVIKFNLRNAITVINHERDEVAQKDKQCRDFIHYIRTGRFPE